MLKNTMGILMQKNKLKLKKQKKKKNNDHESNRRTDSF